VERCAICSAGVDGPRLHDAQTGGLLHPGCVADRLPAEALGALIGALELVLFPAVVVWAG
jgi:hypothetical protein